MELPNKSDTHTLDYFPLGPRLDLDLVSPLKNLIAYQQKVVADYCAIV